MPEFEFIHAGVSYACANNSAVLTGWLSTLVGVVASASVVANFRNYIAQLPFGPQLVKLVDVAAVNFVKHAAQEAAQPATKG